MDNNIIPLNTDITKMTKDDFYNIPFLNDNIQEDILFDSLVIVPVDRGEVHDSGFRHMFFTGTIGMNAKYNISGYSDVLHLDGIGGFGIKGFKVIIDGLPKDKEYHSWSIDCLPNSNLTRVICYGFKLKIEFPPVSSCCVFAVQNRMDNSYK